MDLDQLAYSSRLSMLWLVTHLNMKSMSLLAIVMVTGGRLSMEFM